MHKYIVVFVNSIDKLSFFIRIDDAIRPLNIKILFLTHKPSIYIKLISKNRFTKFVYVHRTRKITVDEKILTSYEVKAGILSYTKAVSLYRQTYILIDKYRKLYTIKAIFIFNGNNVYDFGLINFAKQYGIELLFFELSNIEGKVFIDPNGVNASSSLYRNIEILNKYEGDEKEYNNYKLKLLHKNVNKVMQAKSNLKKNYLSCIDILFSIPRSYFFYYSRISLQYYNYMFFRKRIFYDKLPTKDYIFLPLQVNTDTQILYNSDIDNIQAIKIAKKESEKRSLNLVVKIHPAETDIRFIHEILRLKKEIGFLLVNSPTIDIIVKSNQVITINSSVGLHAQIIGKDVAYLGRTFYSQLDNLLLKNYLTKYLISVDYWDNSRISLHTINELIERFKK